MPNPRDQYVLLDRDGVINQPPTNVYITDPDELALVAGAGEAIARLNAAGFRALVISNQQCVGKGIIDRQQLDAISDRMDALIVAAGGTAITEYFYCPHLATDECDCRKPKPGLIEQAWARYGFDPAATFMIGDSYTDLDAATAAGCPSIFVRSGNDAARYDAGELPNPAPAHVANSLVEAVAWILE